MKELTAVHELEEGPSSAVRMRSSGEKFRPRSSKNKLIEGATDRDDIYGLVSINTPKSHINLFEEN